MVSNTPSSSPTSALQLKILLYTMIDFKIDINSGDNNVAFIGHLMDLFKQGHSLPKEFVKKLLHHSSAHQRTLPNILTVYRCANAVEKGMFNSDLTIVGDVHGQYHDFASIFQNPQLGGLSIRKEPFYF